MHGTQAATGFEIKRWVQENFTSDDEAGDADPTDQFEFDTESDIFIGGESATG